MVEVFKPGEIAGVVVRDLRRFTDERGWLTELFRNDEVEKEFHPVMAYISATKSGVTRGPHEHTDQADLFAFIGPSDFKIRMWDLRPGSETRNNVMTLVVGESNPKSILVPAGVIHGYRNVGGKDGIVINCPNQLYMGLNKSEAVDEIRHEDEPNSIFRMDD
jgi:dTDP-4-dehydrorhamnose 3,5-epimerase